MINHYDFYTKVVSKQYEWLPNLFQTTESRNLLSQITKKRENKMVYAYKITPPESIEGKIRFFEKASGWSYKDHKFGIYETALRESLRGRINALVWDPNRDNYTIVYDHSQKFLRGENNFFVFGLYRVAKHRRNISNDFKKLKKLFNSSIVYYINKKK